MRNINENCYTFKNIHYKNGLYDNFVDMTYILLLENSKREKHVYEQINKFQPTSKVKIQYNKGYKKCKKTLCNDSANWDLFDAHYNVILDAYKNEYKNILILEDDFVINENLIFNKDVINDLNNFINDKCFDAYLLGIPTPKFNFNNKHQKCPSLFNIHCGGTHGYFLTNRGIQKMINLYNNLDCNEAIESSNNGHIDWFYNKLNTYTYYKPLIVQPVEMTENRKNNWNNILDNIYFKLFNLETTDDKEIVESYEKLYNILKIFTFLISIIIIILIFNILFYL